MWNSRLMGHEPRKRFGQNFLLRPDIAERIVRLARLTPESSALEIGPGRGALTTHLAAAAGHLILIEVDRDLVAALHGQIQDPRVEIIEGDILRVDLQQILAGHADIVVIANLPYNISTPVLMRLMERPEQFERLVLMLQKEVAERLCANTGTKAYGALSVVVQLLADVKIAFDVPPTAFRPRPKVVSSVIVVEPFRPSPLDEAMRAPLRQIVRSAFSRRRKQLRNALRPVFADPTRVLQELDIAPERRPETLTPNDFLRLARAAANLS
jgi:16S rRNA (adenine1518-N6/adenine1519-N6)-dimethyltransferase